MVKKLQTGDKAPDFTLKNQKGDNVSLSDYSGKKVLIYFYPRANTPGCTTQSCGVRDAKPKFSELGVDVVGISPDTPKKQSNFDNKHSLGFPLLCDEENKVCDLFGVWGEKKLYGKTYMGLIRSSFLIDEKGQVIEAWYKVSPKKTVPLALEYLNN